MIHRKLKVFLCHASQDKPIVHELYEKLIAEGWIEPWLDAKKLLPGQDWQAEIENAVETADNVIIFLSTTSVNKDGFVQKELRLAKEIALKKTEGSIFLVPVRINNCDVPHSLTNYHWVNYFGQEKEQSYSNLLASLKLRLDDLLQKAEAEHVASEKTETERKAKEERERNIKQKAESERTALEESERKRKLAKKKSLTSKIESTEEKFTLLRTLLGNGFGKLQTAIRYFRYSINKQPKHEEPPKKLTAPRVGTLRKRIAGIFVIVGLCTGSYFVYQYYRIASTLPDVGDLRNRASQFETTRILDRNGQPLYEILDPNAGRRTYIPLKDISPSLLAATIAVEDPNFYSHSGVDFWKAIKSLAGNQTIDEGPSTITQKLARTLLLSSEERAERSYSSMTREILLAGEITRRFSKDEVIELYLNEIYYGNLAYGVEAAAETYFGKPAKDLTVGEAAFLAGLPQSPAIYDIFTNPQDTLIRQQQVLVLMFDVSSANGCIEVSNSLTPICVDPVTATRAAEEMKAYAYRPPSFDAKYPHWVNFVREQLEAQYDAQTIYRSGFVVYTTLDPVMQNRAQQLVSDQIAAMADSNAHNGALVSIRPSTGEIFAMVGSPDFNNVEIAGQVNMATSPTRQPGSSIKPITYIAAFEKGWTPSTLIWDVPTQFPDGANPPYEPRNYDGNFHGGLSVRLALANSFNIPAVKALEFVGIYDDPNTPEKDGLIGMAERLGITSLTRTDYGLSLTLGGGDVSLLDMTSAYSVFANGGQRMPPVSILKITDFAGNIIYEYQPQAGEQVIRAEHAYLISSILSDNEARNFTFGRHSALNLTFPIAAKTGTTNDIRDNWTLGYTPDLVTGVWVGNTDNTPMLNSSGLSGAAPIWSQFMEFAVPYLTNGAPTPFNRPAGIVDMVVCRLSGTQPSASCGSQYSEVFAADQPPLSPGQDLARRVKLDLWTGLEASDACKGPTDEEVVLTVTDKWARAWLGTEDGRVWLEDRSLPRKPYYAPERQCGADDPQPLIEFKLSDGENIARSPLEIKGSAAGGGFKKWRLEYGIGAEPNSWTLLNESDTPVENGTLFTWDFVKLLEDSVTLKLTLVGDKAEIEKRVIIRLSIP